MAISQTRAGPLRLGLVYSALYLGTGIAAPYVPLWFGETGLSGGQIGVILAAPMLARIVTGPLIGAWADGFKLRRTAVIFLATAAALALCLLLVPLGFTGSLVFWFIAATAIGACSPLIDVLVLRRAASERFAYATPRGLGSAAYVAGNVGVGFLLLPLGPTFAVVGAAVAGLLTALAARTLLPADQVHEIASPPGPSSLVAIQKLLKNRNFVLLIVSAGMIQAANAFYYGFSALIWQSQGIATDFIGLLWGFGVACEVVFLLFMDSWRRRIGPERLLILAAGASVVRWILLALSPPLWLLWPLQALHALTLSAPFIASIQLVARLSPTRSASVAQQLNAAFASGLLMGLATLGGGILYEKAASAGYIAMAMMSLAGLFGVALLRKRLPHGAERELSHQDCEQTLPT